METKQDASPERSKRHPLRIIFRPFVTGIMTLLPIALTIGVIAWLAALIYDLAGPSSVVGRVFKRIGMDMGSSETSERNAYFLGVLIAIMLIYVIGFFAQAGLKTLWDRWLQAILSRVPVVSTVYDAAKKLVNIMEPSDDIELQSMSPVMCNFGGNPGTGFPAFMPTSEVFVIQGRQYQTVMIPTAPIPMGGAIICVPKEWITPLDCGIDGLMNMYLSMGTTVPTYFEKVTAPKLDASSEGKD